MKTVKEVSRITGVSVRTLHHYDAIGLLKPSRVTASGYRLYDDTALERLQSIMLFRELEFSLRDIQKILDSPSFDAAEAINEQIKLLELRRDHLEELITHAHQIRKTGVTSMNFKPFDTSKIDQYAAEAKEKWGNTDAYKEYTQKGQQNDSTDALMDLFAETGRLRHLAPEDNQVQAMVAQIQAFITDHYYTCTKPILSGLGQMYVADERFKANIDAAGGKGCAEFVSRAIEIYCK